MNSSFKILLILACAAAVGADSEPEIDYVRPRTGSLNGETMITLHGKNLRMDLSDRNKKNEIILLSKISSYKCRLHESGCTNGFTLQCYTPKFLKDDSFSFAVTVNNKVIAPEKLCPRNKDKCTFEPTLSRTPTITSVSPRSGPPGTLVKICGRIFTKHTQTTQEDAYNKRTIRRVYMGGDICQLNKGGDGQVDTNNLYGIKLISGRDGCFKCKPKSTKVGNYFASFIVSKAYGRSKTQLNALHATAQNEVGVFQAFAEIDRVDPPDGSTEGGTLIKITGKNFDQTDARASVKIAGKYCVVEKLTETEILCATPEKQPESKNYPGNRGVHVEVWRNKAFGYDDLDKIANLTSSDGNYTRVTLDETNIKLQESKYVSRVTGFFVPPVTGNYQFMMKADDYVKLYLEVEEEMKLLSTVRKHTDKYASNEKVVNLTSGQGYYFRALHAQTQGSDQVKIGAKLFNSKFTSEQVGEAISERQEIKITSQVDKETQVITIMDWKKQVQVNEIQEVTMFGDGGEFQLKVDGAATVLLKYPPVDSEVKAALNDLPTVYPEAVEVTSSKSKDNIILKVEFISGGDRKLLEIVPRETGTVREVRKGRSDMNMMQLESGNIPSVPFPKDADKTKIREAILSMFSVRCPRFLASPKNVAKGENVGPKDFTPFCGLTSLKNPSVIFKAQRDSDGVLVSRYKFLCFAYRGHLKNEIKVIYSYLDKDLNRKDEEETVAVSLASPARKWKYQCFNLHQSLERKLSIKVQKISVTKSPLHPNIDMFIDSVFLAEKEVISDENIEVLDSMRLSGPKTHRVSQVTVTEVEEKGTADRAITVVLDAVECSHGFPLIVPYNSQKSNTSTMHRQETWPAGVAVIPERTKYASPPVSGKFSLSLNGKDIKDISAQATASEIESAFDSAGLGRVDVTRKGACTGYSWTVKFLTLPGDQAQMKLIEKTLKGEDPVVEIKTLEDGGLMLDPIPGDMLRTPHSVPQVTVNINNIPSACKPDVCNFEWKEEKTPVLTTVTPTEGTENQVLSVKGTGLSPLRTELRVKVGSADCEPQTASPNGLTCRLKKGSSGNHRVHISVAGKGKAKGDKNFSYSAHVSEVKPKSASKGGLGTSETLLFSLSVLLMLIIILLICRLSCFCAAYREKEKEYMDRILEKFKS